MRLNTVIVDYLRRFRVLKTHGQASYGRRTAQCSIGLSIRKHYIKLDLPRNRKLVRLNSLHLHTCGGMLRRLTS